MRKKVLIYVQAYNAEKTLERCIEECIQIEEDIKTGKIGERIKSLNALSMIMDQKMILKK